MKIFYKLKGNDKGSIPINFVISAIILMFLISFATDFISIAYKRMALSNQINFVSRVVARQGGFNKEVPNNWEEWNRDEKLPYITRVEMINLIDEMMDKYDIESWTLQMNGKTLYMDTSFDFGDEITVTMSINYKWNLFGRLPSSIKAFLAGEKKSPTTRTYTVERIVFCESHIRPSRYLE